jgi:three-Cys-motif partner protein
MRGKFSGGVVYLDVMSGPGRCLEAEASEEFDGSPLVALAHDFSAYYFVEEHPELFAALDKRLENHPKRERIHLINENWVDVAASGKLQFDALTLVVAFVDPTGISAMPMSAMRALMQNPRIDLLVTIQYRLGIVWNAPHYARSANEDTALDRFLDSPDWRQWQCRNASELGSRAVDAF